MTGKKIQKGLSRTVAGADRIWLYLVILFILIGIPGMANAARPPDSYINCPQGWTCISSTNAIARWGAGNFQTYSNNPCGESPDGELYYCYAVSSVTKPIADFTCQTGVENDPLQVCCDGSSSSDPDGISMYYWTFGDRSEEMSSDRPGYCHSYPNWGTYTVTLQVVDRAFPPQSGSAIKSINVQPPVTIPTADFTYSLHCGGNQYQVCFDASLSSDPDGIYRYYWTFGDGSPETFSDQPTDIPHTYPSLGTYSVTLRVFDRSSPPQIGTITKSVTLTTSPTIPTADFTYQPNCNGIPNQVCYDASRSSDPDGFSQYIWTFGDGSPDMHWGQPMYLTHTYPSPGTYTVTLMAVDKEGQFGTITKSVIIPPGGVTVTTTTSTPPGPRPTTPGSLIMVIAALGLMGIFFRRLGR